MLREETIEIIIFCSFILACALAWYFMWVAPRTEFLHAVMDCMNEIRDHSEAGYQICAERVASS